MRESKGCGIFPKAQKRANGYSFAVLAPYSKQGKDGKGIERKRKIKDGHIVVKKLCTKSYQHTKLPYNPVGRFIGLREDMMGTEVCLIKFCSL